MASNETKRIAPAVLASDITAYEALQSITTYAPSNPSHATAAVTVVFDAMRAAQAAESQAEAAFKTARDMAVAAEWAAHNVMIGVKDQVKAQYGPASNEVQALGLKKKTEYKRRTAKAKQDN
jgi:hypothetical protein